MKNLQTSQIALLKSYANLLLHWNTIHNLSGAKDIQSIQKIFKILSILEFRRVESTHKNQPIRCWKRQRLPKHSSWNRAWGSYDSL